MDDLTKRAIVFAASYAIDELVLSTELLGGWGEVREFGKRLRTGDHLPSNCSMVKGVVAKLLQDLRLTHDEQDIVKEAIFSETK